MAGAPLTTFVIKSFLNEPKMEDVVLEAAPGAGYHLRRPEQLQFMRIPLMLDSERTQSVISRFESARIAVVGDYIADLYLEVSPARLSREAPVMVVKEQGERIVPGGAANAANNLCALGATVVPIGVVGSDTQGRSLLQKMSSDGMSTDGMVVQDGYCTISKTRVMAAAENRTPQQILRIDREPTAEVSSESRELIQANLANVLGSVDAVLFSDYGYGAVRSGLVEVARSHQSSPLLAADSRYGLGGFAHVDFVSPNHEEAAAFCGFTVSSDEETERAAHQLMDDLSLQATLVTRGNRGMTLLDADRKITHISAAGKSDEVTDVSGAGDTVISMMTLAQVAGETHLESAYLANCGAGVVVSKLGAATCSPEELMQAIALEQERD